MFLKPPPSDPKCPICKRTFATAKGVSCHIAKEHKGEMFNTDIEGFLAPKHKSPKRKWDHKWQHKSGNSNKKLRRGEQKSDSRISCSIRWKIRKVIEFQSLKNKNKTKWLKRNHITRGQISKWTSKIKI